MNALAEKTEEISPEAERFSSAIGLLGLTPAAKQQIHTTLDMHALLETGLPAKAVVNLVKRVPELADPEIVPKTLGMSKRTLQRYQEEPSARLSVDQSGHAWRFAQILALAIDVFGSRDNAVKWLQEPSYGLERNRPIALLSTPAGFDMVRTYLSRIDAGVYT